MGSRKVMGSMSDDCLHNFRNFLFGRVDNMGFYEFTKSENTTIPRKSSSLMPVIVSLVSLVVFMVY